MASNNVSNNSNASPPHQWHNESTVNGERKSAKWNTSVSKTEIYLPNGQNFSESSSSFTTPIQSHVIAKPSFISAIMRAISAFFANLFKGRPECFKMEVGGSITLPQDSRANLEALRKLGFFGVKSTKIGLQTRYDFKNPEAAFVVVYKDGVSTLTRVISTYEEWENEATILTLEKDE